jgi:hypothetical protein
MIPICKPQSSLAGIAVTFALVVASDRLIDGPAIGLSRMVRPFRFGT